MTTIMLLSAMVLGQCGPRGCPAPSLGQGYAPLTLAPSYVQAQAPAFAAPARPYYVVKTYRVNHAGVSFNVRGYFRPDTGKIAWEPSDPDNAASFAAAKLAQAVVAGKPKAPPVVAVRPERHPVARPAEDPEPKVDATKEDAALIQLTLGVKNYGLSPDKMRSNSTYTTTGEKARKFVAEARAPGGETAKLHVTVIGSDDARAPVVNDLMTHPEFASLKSHLMVQDYRPGEWEVDESLGFHANGKPTIIVQSSKGPGDPRGGRVIYRASGYETGPRALAEAIRKADPNYKPESDPGPLSPLSPNACPLGFDCSHWPLLVGAALVVLVLVKLPRKEG